MSARNRYQDAAPTPKAELRAHARGERHRINTELLHVSHMVSGGIEPDDADEVGAAWKPVHHHDADVAKKQAMRSTRRLRHWKVKAWKRRTALRQAKAAQTQLLVKQA